MYIKTGIAVGLTLISTLSLADSSQCGFITDSDDRAYCFATVSNNSSHCGFINDSDLRSRCRAEVDNNSAHCGFIKDANERALCLAKTYRKSTTTP